MLKIWSMVCCSLPRALPTASSDISRQRERQLTASTQQKQQQQQAENAEGAAGKKKKKVTAAQLRVQRGTFASTFAGCRLRWAVLDRCLPRSQQKRYQTHH